MVLKNARHELFAQAIASGKNPVDAYVLAGFKPDHGNASRLGSLDTVRQRVTAILSAMAARSIKEANYTREWVVSQLIDNVERAKEAGDFSASNAALRLLGSERHMFIDKKETGAPGDFTGLTTPDEVLALVAKELGAETAKVLAAALERDTNGLDVPALDASRDADDAIN